MAVYSGSAGITQLREKIKQKSKMLVGESAEKVAVFMVESSPLGVEYYRSKQGLIQNDVGDFKNSWAVGLGDSETITRTADAAGTAAVADAIVKGSQYNFQDQVYVTNSIDHAGMVEEGWRDNPEYGWKAKEGYHVVRDGTTTAEAILEAVAEKVSRL